MTSAIELLTQLRSLGVQLHLEGETLRLNAPKGSLTPALQSELRSHKASLMELLRAAQSQGGGHRASAIQRAERSDLMALSFAQQRMWFLQQIEPSSTAYNLLAVMRLEGVLDESALERSLQSILVRHEALRTRFLQLEGTPYTVIEDSVTWNLDKRQLERDTDETLESAVERYTALVNEVPFDLEKAPLLRSLLLEENPLNHVLILSVHHIVSDGWSMGVAVQELAENYRSYRLNEAPNLPPLPVQYFDFTEWQREWLEGGILDRQMRFWKKQLEGAPELVVFPADSAKTVLEEGEGKRLKMVLPTELVARLESFSRNHDATLFMTMLSIFMLMLSRYSGQKDVVVGSPSANRGRAELSNLIGFFVNNLVLRAHVDDGISFLDLLRRVRESTLGAYEHQDTPFDHIVRELQTDRNQDNSPLFQTMFSLQNFPLEELELPELKISPIEIDTCTARYDLTVEVYPVKKELQVFFEYRTDLYAEATIRELQQCFEHVLNFVTRFPETDVDRVPLLPTELREKTLDFGNDTTVETFRHATLLEALKSNAEHSPEKIAAVSGTDTLTYRQLDLLSNHIAAELRNVGVASGSLVPVLLNRSVHLLAGLLGVLKTGAAYVPLDPIYPRGRIAAIFEDVSPVVILTELNLVESVPSVDGRLLLMDDCIKTFSKDRPQCLNAPIEKLRSHDRAYVIFTSGSTGKPKGVEVSHGALVNFLDSMQSIPGFDRADHLLAVTTISFDIAGLELFLPLYAGGRVTIARTPADLPALLKDLEIAQPTVVQATPALWQMLASSGWQGDENLKALCGGEALNPQLAKQILPLVKSLWNMYGPTETTIWSSALNIDAVHGMSVPLGKPIANTQFYILDPHLEPVPTGVTGELYIGGAGLAQGYLNRPELSLERFIPSPFQPGSRLYKTGDLVRRRRDGLIDFQGRSDFQVKLRGFRIELGEIEHAIREQPEISESVVLLREVNGDEELVAYVVAAPGQIVSFPALQQQLRQRVPNYMVPATAVILGELPRLPNGKLDRLRLPLPTAGPSLAQHDSSDNEIGATEAAIALVFRELLRIDQVSIDRRFFEFGMHSMLIVKAHDRLRRDLDSELKLVSFFQYPSIAALAEHIDQHRNRKLMSEYAGRN